MCGTRERLPRALTSSCYSAATCRQLLGSFARVRMASPVDSCPKARFLRFRVSSISRDPLHVQNIEHNRSRAHYRHGRRPHTTRARGRGHRCGTERRAHGREAHGRVLHATRNVPYCTQRLMGVYPPHLCDPVRTPNPGCGRAQVLLVCGHRIQQPHAPAHELQRRARRHPIDFVPAEGLSAQPVTPHLRDELLDVSESRGNAQAQRGQLGVRGITEQRHIVFAPPPAHGQLLNAGGDGCGRMWRVYACDCGARRTSATVDSMTSPSSVARTRARTLSGHSSPYLESSCRRRSSSLSAIRADGSSPKSV